LIAKKSFTLGVLQVIKSGALERRFLFLIYSYFLALWPHNDCFPPVLGGTIPSTSLLELFPNFL
jgi:hypothetical protein